MRLNEGACEVTDALWAVLRPLIDAVRPKGRTEPRDLPRTVAAIIYRHRNGAAWRSVPAEYGPWWKAAQTFIRWARLGVWNSLLRLAQERGIALGMAFLVCDLT
ncbi:MAG: transposase [Acetobacteraceae bacterium]|nr:transposase [Acetobacteraceae bacterium]